MVGGTLDAVQHQTKLRDTLCVAVLDVFISYIRIYNNRFNAKEEDYSPSVHEAGEEKETKKQIGQHKPPRAGRSN